MLTYHIVRPTRKIRYIIILSIALASGLIWPTTNTSLATQRPPTYTFQTATTTGKVLFYSFRDGNDEIYVMNSDGTNQTRLTNNTATDKTPRWSPDGTKIAFMSRRNGDWGIWIMNADGSNPVLVFSDFAEKYPEGWSPDGKTISFSSTLSGNAEIYTINVDGTGVQRLTNDPAQDSCGDWSPDGQKLVFFSNRSSGRGIYTMKPDGSNVQKLTDAIGVPEWCPTWSPDGSIVAYPSGGEIYTIHADSSNLLRLTTNATSDFSPDWSPDGKMILFTSSRDGNNEIYIMNADGTNQTRLTNNPANDDSAVWQPSSSSPANLTLTITKINDYYGPIYLPNTTTNPTVDGNRVTATVRIEHTGTELLQGTLSIVDADLGTVLDAQPTTISFSGANDATITFSSIGMAWNAGQRTSSRSVLARFQSATGSTIASTSVSFGVQPRPVILVHGLNDSASSWDTYRTPGIFLDSIGLEGYAIDTLDTGAHGRVVSIDTNADRLAKFIKEVKEKTYAEQVDIVAHSLGGLITRRYITKHSIINPVPDIHQLIMLGTPNAGSESAKSGALGEIIGGSASGSLKELTPSAVDNFNRENPVPQNILFYAVAGNYYCTAKKIHSNPIEPDPDDIAVSRDSVFAIAEHGRWTYPNAQAAGCGGDHRGMRSNAPNDGGIAIFAQYVSPLLRGVIPAAPPELRSSTFHQTSVDAFDAIQFTDVQTGTLQPGGHLEFNRTPEPGSSFSFIVVGPPDQITVRLRDPNGRMITSDTTDADVQYMQTDKDFLPLTSYTITNPVIGQWTTIVETNTQTPATGVKVAALGSLVSSVRLNVLTNTSGAPEVHHVVTVVAQFQANSNPVGGATINALFTQAEGTTSKITLFDDGQHGDGATSDGIYGYQFTPTTPGVYSAAIMATGTIAGQSFSRSDIWATQIDGELVFLPFIQH